MSTTIRTQITVTLSLYCTMHRTKLVEVVQSHPGCEWAELVEEVIDMLIAEGAILEVDGVLSYIDREPDALTSEMLATAESYRARQLPDAPVPADHARSLEEVRRAKYRPTLSERIGGWIAALWHKCWGGCVLIIATTFLTIGLCAQDVPDRVLAALVSVESGCEWRGIGSIKGKWSRGADGEVSCFQLSPAALADMRVTDHARVHRDPVYAESLARLWLSRLYLRHGNWPDSLAAYNAGSRYRSRSAREYAARIINLASTIN